MNSQERFIVIGDSKYFFLTDIGFWSEHEQELTNWCQANGCEHEGMTVRALTDHAFTLFLLRWS